MFDQVMNYLSNMSNLIAIMTRKIDVMNQKAYGICLRDSIEPMFVRLCHDVRDFTILN